MNLLERVTASIKLAKERTRTLIATQLTEPEGGPEYDENDETIYPPGATVLIDGDAAERKRQSR